MLILCRILCGLILPYTAYVFQSVIDAVITAYSTSADFWTFYTHIIMIVGIYMFQAVEEPVESYCHCLVNQRINYQFDKIIVEKLAKMKYSHLENDRDLDLIERVESSSGSVATELFDNVLTLLSGIIKIVGTFLLLVTYSYVIAIAALLVAVPIMHLSIKYGKTIYDWYQVNSQKRRRLEYISSIFTDRNSSIEIKGYNFFGYLRSKWTSLFEELQKKDFKLQIGAWKNTVVSSLLLNLFEYTTYIIMLIPTLSGTITIGTFVGLSKAISGIEQLILWEFSSLFSFFVRNLECWKDYNRLMDFTEDIRNTESNSSSVMEGAAVEFRNVCFRYDNMDHDILHNISFIIKPNELCALVGVNGAGKSTLDKLMLGLYKPNAGEIIINGQNTKNMTFEEQVSFFGVTYQDFERYNISIKDNIALSRQGVIDTQEIKKQLKILGFDYVKLSKGIETIAGRFFGNGVDFSGGEWQKIAIARMLYAKASFYIMDEPTASLDPISEVELYKQMKGLSGNRQF